MQEIKNCSAIKSKVYLNNPNEEKGSLSYKTVAFVERWKWEEKNSSYQGISVSEDRITKIPTYIARNQGFYLRNNPFLTEINEEKFYNHESWLLKDLILTHGQLKENYSPENPQMVLDFSQRPKRTLTIISQSQESINNFAEELGLPLEEKVLTQK